MSTQDTPVTHVNRQSCHLCQQQAVQSPMSTTGSVVTHVNNRQCSHPCQQQAVQSSMSTTGGPVTLVNNRQCSQPCQQLAGQSPMSTTGSAVPMSTTGSAVSQASKGYEIPRSTVLQGQVRGKVIGHMVGVSTWQGGTYRANLHTAHHGITLSNWLPFS